MKSILSAALFLVLCTSLFAQKVNYDSLQLKYHDESAVYSVDKENMVVQLNKGKLNIYSDHVSEIWFLKDNAKSYADKAMYYSYFTALRGISAYSLVPKGKGKFSKVKVTEFSTNNVLSSSIFFDSNKKKSFTFPAAEKGGAGHLEYREVYNDPKFIGVFYFNSYIPVMHSEFSISFPSSVKVEYNLKNTERYKISFSKTEKKGVITYKWVANDIESYTIPDNAPAFSYYAPHVIVRISEVKHENGEVEKILPDVDALYNWYYSLVEKVNTESNPELEQLVDSLTNGVKGNDEKARAIFNWVQSNVKYVAFEDGMGGFVPREAHMVCQRRYGDCKDMASIITTMLKSAGLEGHLTWIGSRDIPYVYHDVPMPIVDNHMISAYKKEDGTYIFLDATGSYTPFGYPTSFIQGKEALIENGKGKYNIVKVPEIPKEKNLRRDSVHLRIEDKVLVGNGMIDSRGCDKLNFVYRMINKSKDKYPDILKEYLSKGNNKIEFQKANTKGLDNRDTTLEIKYEFKLPDYAKFVGDEVYVNMHLEKELKGRTIDIAKRKGIPMECDYKYIDKEIVRLEIPKGMKLEYVPAAVEYKNSLFGFSISYTVLKDEVVLNKEVYIDYLLLTEENFEAWNTMVKELNKAYNEVIILKKK
ncbi:MAG: transglutaminase-like domain-containing protein [Bacteroidetes bacterium]|nr:transglutaminase-like domain-containing protein [Bacteroidota bacterium]